ncbi:hypothetical protein DFA_10029 [Cavenderia fasciculata]|uniref:3-hydroxyisobutyryl-CoA hydrolase n=1 Tax=Cavenderia fasciculata TaxID=261658 RepID=F4Q930_CACFS|nr:uncharacterized protein DFA_10029 [Cavenderia fasciculata]EGG15199.1 hypothetical protein DFA_10029 [Cavenderia fasciculata]|eukprot:XP_004351919.1 hypothetical protein DFA_10029 [Cavenderia fasciculata]
METNQCVSRIGVIANHLKREKSKLEPFNSVKDPFLIPLSESKTILYRLYDNGCLKIIINRTSLFNSISVEVINKLIDLLNHFKKDDKVKCLLFVGIGDQMYRGESDLKEIVYVYAYPKPVITICNGPCRGGLGMHLLFNSKYSIITPNASFELIHSKLGIACDNGSNYYLSRMEAGVGLYLGLTSERFEYRDAMQLGLTTHLAIMPSSLDEIVENFTTSLNIDNIDRLDQILNAYKSKEYDLPKSTFQIGPTTELGFLTRTGCIERCFGRHIHTINEIVDSLNREIQTARNHRVVKWATKIKNHLLTRAKPLALNATYVSCETLSTAPWNKMSDSEYSSDDDDDEIKDKELALAETKSKLNSILDLVNKSRSMKSSVEEKIDHSITGKSSDNKKKTIKLKVQKQDSSSSDDEKEEEQEEGEEKDIKKKKKKKKSKSKVKQDSSSDDEEEEKEIKKKKIKKSKSKDERRLKRKEEKKKQKKLEKKQQKKKQRELKKKLVKEKQEQEQQSDSSDEEKTKVEKEKKEEEEEEEEVVVHKPKLLSKLHKSPDKSSTPTKRTPKKSQVQTDYEALQRDVEYILEKEKRVYVPEPVINDVDTQDCVREEDSSSDSESEKRNKRQIDSSSSSDDDQEEEQQQQQDSDSDPDYEPPSRKQKSKQKKRDSSPIKQKRESKKEREQPLISNVDSKNCIIKPSAIVKKRSMFDFIEAIKPPTIVESGSESSEDEIEYEDDDLIIISKSKKKEESDEEEEMENESSSEEEEEEEEEQEQEEENSEEEEEESSKEEEEEEETTNVSNNPTKTTPSPPKRKPLVAPEPIQTQEMDTDPDMVPTIEDEEDDDDGNDVKDRDTKTTGGKLFTLELDFNEDDQEEQEQVYNGKVDIQMTDKNTSEQEEEEEENDEEEEESSEEEYNHKTKYENDLKAQEVKFLNQGMKLISGQMRKRKSNIDNDDSFDEEEEELETLRFLKKKKSAKEIKNSVTSSLFTMDNQQDDLSEEEDTKSKVLRRSSSLLKSSSSHSKKLGGSQEVDLSQSYTQDDKELLDMIQNNNRRSKSNTQQEQKKQPTQQKEQTQPTQQQFKSSLPTSLSFGFGSHHAGGSSMGVSSEKLQALAKKQNQKQSNQPTQAFFLKKNKN